MGKLPTVAAAKLKSETVEESEDDNYESDDYEEDEFDEDEQESMKQTAVNMANQLSAIQQRSDKKVIKPISSTQSAKPVIGMKI